MQTVPAELAGLRADHTLSRADVDPDALKVLYRLQHAGHIAYLVGGGVREEGLHAGKHAPLRAARGLRCRRCSTRARTAASR